VRYRLSSGVRTVRKWVLPYARSRLSPTQFRPLLSYLFTEWKCNVNCSYCYTYDNAVEGMTLDTARSSLDWLKTTGCRVVALMGGEPLLRKEFVLEVVEYGQRNGFFVYLPTNARLLDERFIHQVGRAGVAAVNVAVDCIKPRPGLPKAYDLIKDQLHYLVAHQEQYGYLVFLNVNITSKNMEDVRRLAEIAYDLSIGVDYHLNEAPHVEQPHYQHADNDTYLTPDTWEEGDRLVDWLLDRMDRGQPTVNPRSHLRSMKLFMRGQLPPWGCLAGQNSCAIRIDGTLAPCFGLYSAREDWGSIWAPRFDRRTLEETKERCSRGCHSLCQYNLMHHYRHPLAAARWVRRLSRLSGRL